MSRCFPFPPPGYERKHRLEDLILLKEATRKEKREKKDKDRKKHKEKKEKDGSEKQRDRKDRKEKRNKKEKHGVKTKDKDDRGKDKEKSSISGKLEDRSGEKVHPEVDEGKCSTFFQGQDGKKPLHSILPSQATKEAGFVQELDRRIRDDEKGRGSQFPPRVADVDKRDQEAAAGTALWNPSHVLAKEKHNDGDKRFLGKKLESKGRNGELIGKTTVQNLIQLAKSNNEGIPRPLEEHNDLRLEDNEKYKESLGDKQGDKRKDRDKKNRDKDKHKKKEKKEEKKKKKKEKANVTIENGKSETEKHKSSGRNDLAGAACNSSVNVLKDVMGAAPNEGHIRKRKDMDTNGFLHESEIRPNKVLALHQSTENGRKLEASSKSSDKHAFPNSVWLDHHRRLNNGTIEAPKPSPSKANPSGINTLSDQIVVPPKMRQPDLSRANEPLRMPKKDHSAEESKRPPHPDFKYLSQILTVPTVGDWSEANDQEWLFSKKGPPCKPVGVTEEPQCCPSRVAEV